MKEFYASLNWATLIGVGLCEIVVLFLVVACWRRLDRQAAIFLAASCCAGLLSMLFDIATQVSPPGSRDAVANAWVIRHVLALFGSVTFAAGMLRLLKPLMAEPPAAPTD